MSMIDEDEERDEVEARLPLSEDEQRVLDLYDQLQQLRLEIAIINAQSTYQPGTEYLHYIKAPPFFLNFRKNPPTNILSDIS